MSSEPGAGPKIGFDSEKEDTDREEIFLDGTLVLVGCGDDKRDPEDPTDLHVACVGAGEPVSDLPNAETGPAWRAEDLYTSTYFGVKRELAEVVTAWARSYGAGAWAVLSAEHAVVPHWKTLKRYDTSIDDIGADPDNPDHRVRNPFGRRRPDGQEIVTEMDARSRASFEPMLGIWLVHNIQDNDYNVEWDDGVDEPERLLEDGETALTAFADGGEPDAE